MHFFPFVYIKVKYIGTTLLKKQQNKHQKIPKNQEINLKKWYIQVLIGLLVWGNYDCLEKAVNVWFLNFLLRSRFCRLQDAV